MSSSKTQDEIRRQSRSCRVNAFHLVDLRLDQRRWNIFGWAHVDTTANFAVPHAVQEIDQQSNSQPDDKTNPGHHRQTQHQSKTQQYPEDWKNWNARHAKGTRPFRRYAAQHVYA